MIDPYKDVANCFVFDFDYIPDPDVDDLIEDYMSRNRMKGLWLEAGQDDFMGIIHSKIKLIVFDTFQVKARDLCYLLDGSHFHKLDPITLAYMMEILGIYLRKDVRLYDISRMYDNYDLMA